MRQAPACLPWLLVTYHCQSLPLTRPTFRRLNVVRPLPEDRTLLLESVSRARCWE